MTYSGKAITPAVESLDTQKNNGYKIILVCEPTGPKNDILNILRKFHEVDIYSSEITEHPSLDDCLMIVFDIDLRQRAVVDHLRDIFKLNGSPPVPLLFVLDDLLRRDLFQLYSLGGKEFVVRPLRTLDVLPLLRSQVNHSVEKQWEQLKPVQSAALKVSLKVFEDMMQKAFEGESLPEAAIKDSCQMIVAATSSDDLSNWIYAIRDHHNYTFRHSMLVCGYLVAFAYLIGIRGEELQTLALGGLLHDVGKAKIPLNILDKPSQLNEKEWGIMRNHPAEALIILAESNDWPEGVVDMATHHHERLDGAGYPDGLKGSEVSDMVRMLAIADTFSALVDKRAYKEGMDGKDAHELMLTMEGQLDLPLVEAFEPVALGRSKHHFNL